MVNQTEFWREIRRFKYRNKPRVVPAFTIQALQENTVVAKPPKCCPYEERPVKSLQFRKYYQRGVFPITMEIDGAGNRLVWKAKREELDYHYYLPLFFDGLTERRMPFTFIVAQGIVDLLEMGSCKVLPVLPQLILPIKSYLKENVKYVSYSTDVLNPQDHKITWGALDTKIPDTLCRTLRIMQRLVRCGNCVGEALVPYFRQILPILNLLKDRCVNYGEAIDYSQQRGENVTDLIQETLEVLEQYGGEDAFINIKYIIPTYESCVKN